MTIFLDTNVLLGLVRAGDPLHPKAAKDLNLLRKNELFVTMPVLVEAVHFMRRPDQRARLEDYFVQFEVRCSPIEDSAAVRRDVFVWMRRYADHTPDYADAHLCGVSQLIPKAKIWTYDSEFRNVWRRIDGSAVPMAAR